jgi:hypothetical protein
MVPEANGKSLEEMSGENDEEDQNIGDVEKPHHASNNTVVIP